jgi:hypothetical protein|tara:strand:+ start:294 stop:704 length:411 start_codon:yes stop_codon:yes gene_type:complete
MAVFMQNTVTVTVNSVDLTDHITSVSGFNETCADLQTTAMGETNISRIGGLKDSSVSITFLNDFAASKVYATLKDLLGTAVNVTVQPVAGSATATNPKKTGSCLITELPFIDGSVGDLAEVSVTWPVTGAITTATS